MPMQIFRKITHCVSTKIYIYLSGIHSKIQLLANYVRPIKFNYIIASFFKLHLTAYPRIRVSTQKYNY